MNYRERIYSRYATVYQDASSKFDEKAAERWSRPYNKYLKNWLPGARDARILEVACGGGGLLYFLKQKGYKKIEGIDISREQVELSRQVLDEKRVHEGDAIHFLERHNICFDMIVGLDVIEHFTKDEVMDFLDACFRSLRPGGRLILQTPNLDSPFGGGVRYGDYTHELGFNANSLSRLLTLTGFTGVEFREMGPVAHGIPSFVRWFLWQGLKGIIRAWNLIEMGTSGGGICTRVILASARKPEEATHGTE